MRNIAFFCMLAGLSTALGCARGAESRTPRVEVPEDWQRVAVEGVSFALPPGLEEMPGAAITGMIRHYEGLQLHVTVHSGDYASTLSEFESASGSYEWLQLDGRRARGASVIMDGRAYDGVYIPEPGKDRQPVSILAISLTPEGRQQGMLVLQTVRFE